MFIRSPLTLLLFALVLTGCEDSGEEAASRAFARGPTPVVIDHASRRTIRRYVEAIGTTRANESLTVTAKVTDKVNRVLFEDGGLVQAGDVLVELTNAEETALLAEADANVDDARTQFERLNDLLQQRSVPVSQVDEASARLAAAQARQRSIRARLADRLIQAPFSGMLGFRQVSEGTLITPGTAITTLDDISTIKLDFSVPEVHLGLLESGAKLQATSAAFSDEAFDAVLHTVGSRIDPVTRAATVRAHIDNASLRLRPGMLMTVRLNTAAREATMVPEDALVQRSGQAYVFTIADNRAQMRAVEHGDRYEGWVEISRGLEPGDAVIVEGIIKVRDGMPVQVSEATAETGRDLPPPA